MKMWNKENEDPKYARPWFKAVYSKFIDIGDSVDVKHQHEIIYNQRSGMF